MQTAMASVTSLGMMTRQPNLLDTREPHRPVLPCNLFMARTSPRLIVHAFCKNLGHVPGRGTENSTAAAEAVTQAGNYGTAKPVPFLQRVSLARSIVFIYRVADVVVEDDRISEISEHLPPGDDSALTTQAERSVSQAAQQVGAESHFHACTTHDLKGQNAESPKRFSFSRPIAPAVS